jgi:rubrerythrin
MSEPFIFGKLKPGTTEPVFDAEKEKAMREFLIKYEPVPKTVKVVCDHVSGAYLDCHGGCDGYTCEACGAEWMMDNEPDYCPGCGQLVYVVY